MGLSSTDETTYSTCHVIIIMCKTKQTLQTLSLVFTQIEQTHSSMWVFNTGTGGYRENKSLHFSTEWGYNPENDVQLKMLQFIFLLSHSWQMCGISELYYNPK